MCHVSLVIQATVKSLLFLHSGVVEPVEGVLQLREINALDNMRRIPIRVAGCRGRFQVLEIVPERVDPNFEYST